jgi:hypothetical protein
MDELTLIEATERLFNGEMSEQEIAYFDEIRKNDYSG